MDNLSFLRVAAFTGSLLFCLGFFGIERAVAQGSDLRVVLIRHAEKPAKGYNLTCQGMNRSLELVPVLYSRFGLPAAIYVPALGQGDTTKHSRMFETIVPFASKYNLLISTAFGEDDTTALAGAIKALRGTVFVVWEHSRLPAIARCLGVRDERLHWRDEDYDSLWIVRWVNGEAVLVKDKEGLHPGEACPN
ncbi:MAG TPA: hypothetical protein VHE34_02445 [Puia sp.]|uniref:histidine phosphatase family protein n=1 Tax=Puia sp. TaxID=2045100 RepID=UPI002C3DB893|nr:histidine phosphatase family protein [Puia sp.]HVU94047.1 hypothetical protein [Puia sp.]